MNTQTETIPFDVPNAPAIPGLVFRRYRGPQDLPGFVAIENAISEADDLEEVSHLADFERRYSNLRNCDLEKDIYIAEIDSEMIGYGRTEWEEQQIDDQFIYTGFFEILPEWRGKGIGRAIHPVLEARLRELANGHRNDTKKFMSVWCGGQQKEKVALFRRFDYKEDRFFYTMKRDLNEPIPELSLPEGLERRPVKKEQLRQIWEAMHEAFRDHWGYSEPDEEDFNRFYKNATENPKRDLSYWYVAWDGDEVAGMVLNMIDPEGNEELGLNEGWTDPICVRRQWRKQGLASALMAQSMQFLKDKGLDTACLGVDTANPNGALGLYERAGYRQTKQWINWRKPIN